MSPRFVDMALILVGVAFGAGAYSYGLWRKDWTPGDGLFPFLSALVLVGAVISGLGFTRRRVRLEVPWRLVSGVVLALVGYALVLSTVGFPIATTALLLLIAKQANRTLSWRRAVVVAVLLAVGTYLIFTRALGVPLPAGVLSF
jgi:hypothetical protein